jgi:hypothetical protein
MGNRPVYVENNFDAGGSERLMIVEIKAMRPDGSK